MQAFPTDPAGRKQLHETLKAEAPELMDDVAALRALFPKARMTYVKTESVEVGEKPSTDGIPVTDQMLDRVITQQRREAMAIQRAIDAKAEKKAMDARKRERKKRT